jgi:hypothetical protein
MLTEDLKLVELPDMAMPGIVDNLTNQFRNLWYECDTTLPDLGLSYSPREQEALEKDLKRLIDRLLGELRHPPQTDPERELMQQRISATIETFARSSFGFDEKTINVIRSYGFADIAVDFTHQARRFDPDMTDADIFQASRNVWSMNFMQALMGLPVQMTPSIFAYSMLYPLTDNYLDDPAISIETKKTFNRLFQKRLAGMEILPANAYERTISNLVEIIEDQFERSRYTQVFDSLQAIHQAQAKSLNLLNKGVSPYEMDVLGICFEKGGTSVLADGCLVAGSLTPAQCEFMFFYGTFTQLMDDLEDVQEDLKVGLETVFSQTARHWPLDAVTNRTFHFANRLLQTLDAFAAPGTELFTDLLRRSFNPLLIAAAGSSSRLYTRAYLRQIESHLPVRFAFLLEQRRRLERLRFSAISLVEAFTHQ